MNIAVPDYTVAESVWLDQKTVGVIVVDMQNDFVKEGGKLVVPEAQATIPAIQRLLHIAKEHGGWPVFYTQDTHDPGDVEFPIWGEHCLAGTWGWNIIDELKPDRWDMIFMKPRYDGFFGTALDQALKNFEINTIIVCGTVANICVLHTAGSAAIRGHKIVYPIDAVSALTPFDGEAAIRQVSFLYRGTITRSTDIRVRSFE